MRMNQRRTLLAGAVLGGAFALSAFAGSAVAAETIKIGVLMPTSGGGAAYGTPAVNGVKLAVDEINAAGGVNGKKIEYIVRDSKLKPAIATAAAKELITKEGVDLLFGAVSSGVGLAISEVAKQEKIVYFAPISKTKKLTDDRLHKYVFQGSANTEIEGKSMADLAVKLGMKKICVSGFDYAYSHDLFDAFQRNLPAGVKVTGTYHVKLGTKDYSAVISQLMGADCDGIAGAIWGGGFIAFAKQGKPFGLFKSKKFVWGAEVGSHEMAGKLKGDYPENMWANSYDVWYHSTGPKHDAFHNALSKLEGTKEVNMWPITTYTAMHFVAAGIAKAGSTDPDKLAAALEGLTIDTPLGERTIDAKTHRVNTGEFWGPMKPSKKGDFYEMNPITYIPG